MTVPASYTPVLVSGGSGADYTFGFKVFNASDVIVALVNKTTLVATPQTISTHYTVAPNTSTPGGTIHFLSSPSSAYYVSIRRTMTLVQGSDIPSGGLFREVQIENAFDKAMMISQEQQEILDRAVLQNPYGTIEDLILPIPSAGKALKWNATADGLENTTVDIELAIAAAAASAVAAAASAGTASTQAGLAASARSAADADAVATAADRVQTGLDKISTAADRVQTGLDKIATAADRVQTALDKIATNADVVLTHADVVTAGNSASTATSQAGLATTAKDNAVIAQNAAVAAQGYAEAARDLAQNYAAALKGTSTSSLAIATGSKTFVTQSGKQFAAGQYVIAVSDANPANYMHGQVTSYSGTSLVVNVLDIGGSGTLADWTISVSGSRGAAGAAGVQHMRCTLPLPNDFYTNVGAVLCLVAKLDGAITITNISCTCDADPATEIVGDIKYADAFIGLANAAVVAAFDTAAGVFESGAISVAVASGKCVYVSFDSAPIAAIKQIHWDITFNY